MNHATRRIICTPESDSTISLISPTFNRNDASSNGFCIFPRVKKPRSPPRLALLNTQLLRIPAAIAFFLSYILKGFHDRS